MNLSLIIRRTHMYTALFLSPWMLMYALSTAVMNHRNSIRELYGGEPPAWEAESEMTFDGTFPADASPQMVAEQILSALDMEGAHGVRRDRESGLYTINRNYPVTPRRILFDPADSTLRIERLEYQTPAFLERMHRRRGYRAGLGLENAWAFSVDFVIVAMVFWVASGLWMWWGLRVTRRWGAICAVAGLASFALFLITI